MSKTDSRINGFSTAPKRDVEPVQSSGPSREPIVPSSTNMTNEQKWVSAIFLGLLFAIISSPAMYSITSLLTKEGTLYRKEGGPTMAGLILHTVVFALLVRLIMW